MRRVLAGFACLVIGGLLWLPTGSRKADGYQFWEVTRFGVFGYRTTERCWGMWGSWNVEPGHPPVIDWPAPKEPGFSNQHAHDVVRGPADRHGHPQPVEQALVLRQ